MMKKVKLWISSFQRSQVQLKNPKVSNVPNVHIDQELHGLLFLYSFHSIVGW
jgi:hypothetical protein